MVYVVAASHEYLRRRGQPKTPAELEHHKCLCYSVPGYGARWRFRTAEGFVNEVPVHGRVVVTNGVALRQCAVAGLGVLMLPRWNIAEELRTGALVGPPAEAGLIMSARPNTRHGRTSGEPRSGAHRLPK